MTKQELYEHLNKHFAEETLDVEKYLHLAETAEEVGNYALAQQLLNVAKDEYTHGKMIMDHIQSAGASFTPDEKNNWDKAVQHLFKYVK